MLHGKQILDFGKIVDPSAGNNIYIDFMNFQVENLEELQAWYKPLWDKLLEEFKSVVNVYKEFVPPNPPKLSTIKFLENCGNNFNKLQLELAISVVNNVEYEQLYEFHITSPHSPFRSEVAKECCGLVLEKGIL